MKNNMHTNQDSIANNCASKKINKYAGLHIDLRETCAEIFIKNRIYFQLVFPCHVQNALFQVLTDCPLKLVLLRLSLMMQAVVLFP